MKPVKPSLLLPILIALTAPASQAAGPELEEAFHSCLGLTELSLATDLKRSVWSAQIRSDFPDMHAAVVEPNSLSVQVEGWSKAGPLASARVELKQPAPVASVNPVAMTAVTCVEACNVQVWTLEFGRMLAADKARLVRWVKSAPATKWEARATPIQAKLLENSDGTVELVCDVSL